MAKQHLLLVEREAKIRRLLKVSLEQAGYDVSTARDGADALQKLELHAPALVLSATELPRLDGYALVRRMKENAEWARIPVIFMVAGESIEDKIRGLELGVEDYLSKPVFVKELLARVQVLLAKRVRRHLSTSAAATRVQGQLDDLPTIDLLESLELGRQSGTLRITSGDRVGEVWFQDGEIIDARLKSLRGDEVVFRVLCWTHGTFEVDIHDVDGERVIESGTRALIEAGMRHAAEYNRLLSLLPGADVVLEVDHQELAARMGDIPAELEGILRLLDGERSILDVIDDSPFDDISTLQTIVKLYGERLLRQVMGTKAKSQTIPGPPRTPRPPDEESVPPEDDDPLDAFDDQLPTMRPPRVAAKPSSKQQTRLGHRVAHVVPPSSRSDEDGRQTLEIEEPLSPPPVHAAPAATVTARATASSAPPPAGEPAPPTPRRGGLEAQPRESGPSAAPQTPEGYRAPSSIAPATDDVDAAFERPGGSDGPSAPSDAPPPSPPPSEPDSDAPVSEPEPPVSEPEPESEPESEPAPASAPKRRARPVPSDRPRARTISSEPPPSGPSELSESGVSDDFFASLPPGEDLPEPVADAEPVYLTDEQAERKRRSMRLVAVVVGILVALTLFVIVRGRQGRDDPVAQPTAATTTAAEPPTTKSAWLDVPSAAPSASASAMPAVAEGGAGTAEPDAGTGGAPAQDPAVAGVDDPLKEAERLNNIGRYRDAIPMALAAAEKDPKDGTPYFWLAIAHESLGERDKAKEAYAKCAELGADARYAMYCAPYKKK